MYYIDLTVNTKSAVISLHHASVTAAYSRPAMYKIMGLTDVAWRTLYLLYETRIREISNNTVLDYYSD